MANSGSFNTNGYENRYLTFEWSVASQSIANNTTTINWTLKGAGVAVSTWYGAGNFKVIIDEATVYFSADRIYLYNGTLVASGSYTLQHDNYGNKTFTAYAEAGIYYFAVNCSGSGTWDLPTIPRAANITSAPDFTDIQNPTITYSNPAGNNVDYLQACISLTGSTDDIAYRNISKTGSTYTFQLTEAERNVLRQATTTSKTRTIIFYLRTMIGNSTFYSTSSKTLTIVNANPTISTITYQDTNSTTTAITQNNQIIIRNNSTLRFILNTLNALKYATLSSVSVTINGVTTTASGISGTSISNINIDVGTINVSQNTTASIVVTDSRGYSTTYTKNITIADWVLPSALISLKRRNNYYTQTDITVDGSISSIDNKNTMTIQYQYKKTTDSTYSALATLQDNVETTFNIDNQYAWNIRVIVSDLLGSTTYNLFVDKGIPLIFFDRLNNSVGVNCFPTSQESLEVDGNLKLNSNTIFSLIYPVGSYYYTSDSSFDPNNSFTGTWSRETINGVYRWHRTN